jgi:hypothetical protein
MPTDNDDEPAFDYAAMIRENKETSVSTQKRHKSAAKSTGKPAAATKASDKKPPRTENYNIATRKHYPAESPGLLTSVRPC